MDHRYHVQLEIDMYRCRMLPVPADFPVNPDALHGLTEERFRAAFSSLHALMAGLYRAMRDDPAAFGLPQTPVEILADGEPRTLFKRDIDGLGEVAVALAASGTPQDGLLRVDTAAFYEALKRSCTKKAQRYLSALSGAGFAIGPVDKRQAVFTVAYPASPDLLLALKAYAEAPPMTEDFRERHIFDWRRVSDRSRLPADHMVRAAASVFDAAQARVILAAHEALLAMGLRPVHKETNIEYHRGKTRAARLMFLYHGMHVLLILKLKDMDRYTALVEALPPHLRGHFEQDGCAHCGFQGATDAHCKFRLHWTLDGIAHEACNFPRFTFVNPQAADVPQLAGLLAAELGVG